MNNRFFIKLAVSNMKKNGKFYIPYMITCIFSVAMFYIIQSLSLNPGLKSMAGGDIISYTMYLGSIVVGMFALVFLIYANSFLIKRRKKELGVFHILGMEKRHLAKTLAWETIYVSAISFLGGLILGIAFDKVMYLLIIKIIGGKITLSFFVSKLAIARTLLLFIGIFTLIYLYSVYQIRKANPIELLHGSTVGEKEPKTNWPFAVLGIMFVGAGYFISLTTNKPVAQIAPYFYGAVLFVIVGTYMIFTASSIALLKILRKRKNYYYQTKHFISVSNMLYRMKQNAVGLANICILSTMVLVMVSSTGSLVLGMDDMLKTLYPNDFDVYSGEADLQISKETIGCIRKLQQEHKVNVTAETYYTYLMIPTIANHSDFSPVALDETADGNKKSFLFFVPLSDYNEIMGADKTLGKDEILVYSNKKDYSFETLNMFNKSYNVKETVDEAIGNGILAKSEGSNYMIVVPDMDELHLLYECQRTELGDKASNICCFYGFDSDMGIEQQREFYNLVKDTFMKSGYTGTVEYKADVKAKEMGMYGGSFFVGAFLGTLFTIAMVLIIYYKQISEGYDDKDRFIIMQKVGMSKQEVKDSIRSQVQTVFFLPLIAAGVHVAAAFPMIVKVLVQLNLRNIGLYVICTIVSFLVFAMFYMLIYRLTAKTYYKIVNK